MQLLRRKGWVCPFSKGSWQMVHKPSGMFFALFTRLEILWSMGESMVFYTKKLTRKYQFKKKTNFHENTTNHIQILLEFYFETMVLSIRFVLSCILNLRKFGIIKARNKYF
jgi:hypothetical protein